jgi:formylglycine-generating enzyme required for sulfatase activity
LIDTFLLHDTVDVRRVTMNSSKSWRVEGILIAVVAVLLMAPPAAYGQGVTPKAGKKYALLVGVDRYDKGTLLPDLTYPQRDVDGLASVLIDSGYARKDVIVMTRTSGSEDTVLLPNAAHIRNQLSLLLKPLKPGDSIVVLLCGHGVMMDAPSKAGGKPRPTSFFCPMDADLKERDLTKFLALDEFYDALAACKASTKFLLVDACRNELKSAPAEARAPGIEMPPPPLPPASVAALYSCAEKEVSWEDSKLGGGHGVFSHFLIEGLKGAADQASGNRDGKVTLDELKSYVTENVFEHVRARHSASQEPRFLGNTGFVVLRDRVSRPPAPEFLNSSVGIKLKRILAGKFLMGSRKDIDKDAKDHELPQHEVRISRAFYLGVTEVTQGQYRAVTGANPSNFKGSDDLPVDSVSWFDSVRFCNALSEKEGLPTFYRIDGYSVIVPDWKGSGYRLPTEAEWEYACRAGSPSRYSFGDDAARLGDYGWFVGNSGRKTHAVGQKRANKFGLYDMHGNVLEWCWDWHGERYYAGSPVVDPTGPDDGLQRVIRGGSCNAGEIPNRAAMRPGNEPAGTRTFLGLRLARVASIE